MERIVPWEALCGVIEPYYPKPGNGRPPVGLELMLTMYFVQHWFNLADVACEDALLDSTSLRRFVGIDLGRERVPDATTLLKFRRLLEKHNLGAALFAKVGDVLQANGLKVGAGTIVDATIIGATSSTKNAQGKRDPEMRSTSKNRQWFFGMKLHIGVDSKTGLAHSAVVTSANVHDKHPLPDLMHGAETHLYGDCAYSSQQALIHSKAPNAQGLHQSTGDSRQCDRGPGEDREPVEVQGALTRGARVRGCEAALGIQQSALSGLVQECHARVRGVSTRQTHIDAAAPRVFSPAATQFVTGGTQQCGSNSSMRLIGCVGSRMNTSFR
ncbi:IS5 family transposase [Variovorax sp. GrIS 2.14]